MAFVFENRKNSIWPLAPLLAIFALTLGFFAFSSAPARAEPSAPMIEITPASASAGATMSWGQCPCFRWSVHVQVLGGRWETRDFLISTDALFKFQETRSAYLSRIMSRLYTVGAIEALWKGGHVGLGFDGVTVGGDIDKGYSDIIRTGLYYLINVVNRDGLRFDIRSGYQFSQQRINLGDTVDTHTFSETAVLRWNTGRWSGNLRAGAGLVRSDALSGPGLRLDAAANVHARVLTIGDLQAGLGLDVEAERDPFREAYGLATDSVSASLYMDLSFVEHPFAGGGAP